jgi:DNA polymerase III subunit epsilon
MTKYAIIDVETTGGAAKHERITEIAIVLHDGERVLDTFSTLLNPERSIPINITRLTGITNQMVADAPKFFEVAKRIVEMTEDAIFVAHNVNFDYSFVREEFNRLGYSFIRKQLCTVRMSRKTFPGLRSYSLGNLKQHFNVQSDRAHRALDDTLATVEIFERILAAQEGREHIKSMIAHGVKESKLPPAISLERLDSVPEACGVYYFHDAKGQVIYVGKSLNIRKRLFEHFADTSPKGEKLRNGVAELSWEVTGSELAALLYESAQIKQLQPSVNRAQRRLTHSGGIFAYHDQRGYLCLTIGQTTAKNAKNLRLVADYPKLDNAKMHLESVQRQYELCGRLCHLDFSDSACFYYNIKKCYGACVGEEAADDYNARAEQALSVIEKRLSGSFLVIEEGRTPTEKTIIAVENGRYTGFCHVDASEPIESPAEALEWVTPVTIQDPDAARIIRTYLDSQMRKKAQVVRVG